IDSVRVKVERPSLIRAPIFSYASILVFHTVRIVKIIKSFKPDVIIGMGILNANLSARLAKLFGIPFVYYLIDSLHTLIPEKYLQPFGRFVESRTLMLADQVLAINKHLGSYASRMGARREPKIITAGIDKTRFNPDVDGTAIRGELGIHENEIVIFFMGWLYDFSGLREVAQSVSETASDVRLLVLGRGDLLGELKELSARTHANKIIVLDWVSYENVPKYLSAADICILPAHLNEIMRDIVPIKLYEYLACWKPVIVTKLPGVMKEFGKNNGIVYVDHPEDVVEQAKVIHNDEKLYNDLSHAALQFSESLDWEEITGRFLGVLQKLLH
ncbi:MAG: glycosyltransferase family 4 protein, partial [Candidatus Thorarchaeota archaeon]